MDLYIEIEQAIYQHKEFLRVGNNVTEEEVRHAIREILRNNPDIFWFSHQWKYMENVVYFRYIMDEQRCRDAKIQIDDVVRNDFGLERVCELSVVNQVMYVYKWVALYCRYNIHSAYNQTIYSVFVYRNSVCTGIAKAAQYLLQILNIESKLVFGKMNHSDADSRHCWLMVQINGSWYHLDPTFAMSGDLMCESGVEPIIGQDCLYYNFFCTDTDSVKQSRTIEDENTLPSCHDRIPYTLYQRIEVFPSRHRNNGGLGCLLTHTGSTADIYLAHAAGYLRGMQSVAKVFREDPNHDLLRKELKLMKECAAESHLLRAKDADFDKGILYVEQSTALSELLASHYFKLTVKEFCLLLLDLIAGLKELLRHGIVYRDIHLKNIYLSDTVCNGRNIYKLGDFGSCTFLKGEEKYYDGLTDKGGVGSKWFMAPETWNDGTFDECSAVYAVGMVAYHLLNDLYPPLWQKYGEKSHRIRVNGASLPMPCQLERPDYKFLELTFLRKAICYAPSDRYNSLYSLEAAIEECIQVNQRYENVVIIKGADSPNKNIWQQVADFYSIFSGSPFIEESNGGDILYDIDSDRSADCSSNVDIDCYTKGKSASPTSNDCFSRINDFACSCELSFDTRETYVSFIPKNTLPKNDSEAQMTKANMRSWDIFNWFRGTQNRKDSNTKESLSSVNSSVFAPSEAKFGDYMMVQVFLYQDGEEELVLCKAAEVDSDAIRRNYTPLSIKLKKGDVVKVTLSSLGSGIVIEEAAQELIWNCRYADCQFAMLITNKFKESTLISTVTLSVYGVPAGRMMFRTNIVNQPRNLYAEIDCKIFHKIFISYSHKDEQRVKYIAEAYRAQGVDYFFDRHYLKAGDIYPLKIQQYINSADLFILCWSKNAAESDYVTLERHQALALAYPQVDMEKATLTIHPIGIEPRAEYPKDMNELYNFEEV